jgi:hypothetical protein
MEALIEEPSKDPGTFWTAVRLTSLEALRLRLGDGFYAEAMRKLTEQPPRSVPTDRQHRIRVESLGNEHGVWNGLRYCSPIDFQNVAPMTHGDNRILCRRLHRR